MMAGRAASVLALLLGVFVALVAVPATHARPQEGIIKPPMPSDTFLNISDAIANAANAFESPISEGVVPFYAQPSEDSCAICEHILSRSNVAEALSPEAAANLADEACSAIERDTTRWQCRGIAANYIDDLINGHCNTACADVKRERRSVCQSHVECLTTQFCGQNQECQACSVCAMEGVDVALGGYCPCLGGTIEGITPAEGSTVVGGTLQTIEFKTENVGPAVNIELYKRGENTKAFRTIQQFVRVSDTGVTKFTWPVSRYYPSGSYYITITSIASSQIVGLVPTNGYFQIQKSLACKAHEVCSATTYCDIYSSCYYCDECERWQDAFDGQCPEKCYKSIATRAQVTFQLPKATSKIATNSYLPIVWNYNALVLDHIDLYLLPVNSFNSLLALSINQEVSAGSLAYKVPRDFPPGKYWIVATHTADASLQVIGYTPDRANTIGDTGFEIFQEDCPSHDSCEDTEYCDADGSCYPCDDCFRTGAAFDGTCPQKCGTGTVMEFGTSIPDGPEADASGVILEFILPQCPEFKALQHLTATETVKPDPPTSNGDPSVMSKRLRRHITTLASVVRGVFGDDAYVRVLEAYVEPPADISKASLHNVGRAARITIEGVPDDFASDRLGVLGGLAVEAGFDYVAYTSRDSLYVSVIADQCRQNLDLVFLLDGSGSIESTALGGAPGTFQDRVLAFVSQVTTYFTIGEHDTRVAVATFASGATVNIRLNDHFDGDALRDAIADIPYPQGQTYTSLGLRAVRQDILTEANGMRPASEGVPRVLVVLTDGNSQPSYDPATEASILHDQNVNVFAIGVGSSISQSQLEDIASDPDARHVFNLRSFSLIGDIVDAMSATTCDAPAVLTAGDSVSSVVRPCETLFFRPLCGQITNLNIELKSERGAAVMYVAFNNQHPSPFDYDFAVTGTDELKRLTLNRSPDDTDPVYIAVQANVPAASADDEDAALAGVDFVLTVYSDIFPGVADTVVQVAEDRPVGTVIFTPPATQLADPQPVFEFSLVGRTDEQFSIDATTGAVSIARPLDHELVSSYRLRISARAIGLPCLTGAIDIVVSVIDVNDNAPVFAQSLYQVAVDEGRPRNTLVLQVQATDADSGANAMIVYSLATQNVPFAIDGASGVIVTTEVLNNDVQQEYQLAVVASDGVRSATAKVYVTVNPVPCPLGTASATGTLPCVACPDGTFQDGSAPVADTCFPCGCGEGEYATGSCTPKHNYDCRSCPVYSYSEAGSIQLSDCECKDGYFKIEDEGTNTFFCAPCTEQCPAGSYQTAACSPKHDIECAQCTSTCPSGHFLSGTCGGTSNYECTPCATCQAGQFISSPCQVTGNRECSACTTYADCEQGTEYIDGLCTMGTDTSSPSCQPCIDTCAPGAFLTGECGGADGTSRTRCQQCTVCTTSQYLVSDCTDDADRQCADCVTECDAGSYLVGECNPMSTDAPRCEPCTTEEDCEDNEYLDNGVCGGSSTPECQTCHPSCLACDGPGPESCTDCPSGTSLHEGACLSECPLGTYSVDGECQACSSNCLTCNGTSDTCTSCDTAASLVLHDSECVSVCPDGFFKDFAGGVCRRCKTCSGGTYKVGGCQGATNTQCEPWSAECVPGVSFESVTPTPSNDRECTMCKTSCPAGEQLTGECITEDRTCVPCPSGTYKEAAGGQACVPCPTSCAQNEYLDGTCTVTTSTVCRACTTECENDIYLSGTCNGTRSYPTCEECSTCGEDQYVLRACSSANGGSNTVCRDCTQTCPEGHYMSSPCSANADAVCTPCTTADACLSTEVLIGTCGGTETTQCVPCHPECLTCSGPSASNCTSCERGVFLSGTECRTECDLGFYPSTASGECELCHPSCRDCVGATSTACTSCNSPLFLLGTECVAGCPTGYFGDTTSQTCRQCRQCPTGTYKTGGCDGTQDTVCTMWTPCAVGEYEVVSPTAFRDRECAACRQSCPAGSELVGECGGPEGTSNPSCEPCDAGFFKEEPGAGSCQACRTSCEAGSFLTGQCSTTTQPTCQLCKSSCGPDHYLTGVCEGRQDFTCEACNTCEEGEYEVAPCLGSGQNRQCATCRTSCPAGQFLTGMCQGTTQPQCMSCRTQEDCAENEFVSGECGGADGRQNPTCESCDGSCARCDGSAPTDCVACSGSLSLDTDTGRCVSDCSAGTYAADNVCEDCDPSCAACFGGASTECTACFPDTFLSNGRCVATCPQGTFANATTGRCQTCSQCPSGTFVEAACTTTSNTVCTAWTECAPGTYQSTAPTTTSDRVCSTCTTTCPAGQELSVSCTPTHNAQCTACNAGTYKPSSGPQACQACVQSCSEGYYVSGTCTATSTPTCILCTSTCAEGFFLQGECAGSSNPHCEACDTCDIGKYETRACTLNSDRQCSACTTPDACAQGEYLDGECTPTSNPRCKPCTTTSQCGADQFLAGECAADAPNPTCTTCTTCAGDEYEAAPCTETSDRQCAKCTDACPNGHFLTGACPGSLAADFPRTVVVDGVTYAALDATFPEDTSTSCQAQASLPSGWSLVTNVDVARDVAAQHPWGASCLVVSAEHAFATANSATLSPGDACHCDEQLGCMTSSSSGLLGVTACPRRILMQWAPPACQQCTSSCPDNHFLDGECGGRSNPVCRPCTVCEEGFYETVACTHLDVGTQDRVCEPCVTEDDCAEGEYLSGMCGGTSTPT
ncbi:hypothetical protein PTSG_11807 [Salpingoeca rosetta]|uniref:Uncharacterized protein n=1 Tax=Salpingoeca rosetta (strain ATCC 50818 / BSB-021) TaxID=946362 RepID=F2TZE6_SALR5|nr:uncharacterized protein PTSG_11807 [Salpingoeca rosetta]EGD78970.1 hypothetical protein PTSG_11807 [Salpingoeca rosetta]|eukprot:XP_004997926.1 hypothetical protein PTSG_11807 [Salpingoeca rosetta]